MQNVIITPDHVWWDNGSVHDSETGGMRKLGSSRSSGTERIRIFIGIAAALWLIAAVAAVIDRDTLMAVSWACLAVFGGLVASGAAHRSRGIGYLAIALVVVGVAISMGLFLAD
jgi:hypothetical protein